MKKVRRRKTRGLLDCGRYTLQHYRVSFGYLELMKWFYFAADSLPRPAK